MCKFLDCILHTSHRNEWKSAPKHHTGMVTQLIRRFNGYVFTHFLRMHTNHIVTEFIPSVSVGSPEKVLDLKRCTSSNGGSFINSNVIVPISSKELTVISHSSFNSLHMHNACYYTSGYHVTVVRTSWPLPRWSHLIGLSRRIHSTSQPQILSSSYPIRFFLVR